MKRRRKAGCPRLRSLRATGRVWRMPLEAPFRPTRGMALEAVAVITLTVGLAALESTQAYFGSRLSIVGLRIHESWLSAFWVTLPDGIMLALLVPAVQWLAMRRRLDTRAWLP